MKKIRKCPRCHTQNSMVWLDVFGCRCYKCHYQYYTVYSKQRKDKDISNICRIRKKKKVRKYEGVKLNSFIASNSYWFSDSVIEQDIINRINNKKGLKV